MNKNRAQLRLLLVQVRSDQFVKNHEQSCFRAAADVPDSQLVAHDLLEHVLPENVLPRYDGVIIGGVSDFSADDMFPNRQSLVRLVEDAQRERVPIFAACWGAQFLAGLLGGAVEQDTTCGKVSEIDARLAEAASDDPVFAKLPKEFRAHAGHNEHITRLPNGGRLLATSDHCPIQAFSLPETGAYGVQFHPELTLVDAQMRLNHTLESHPERRSQIESLLAGLGPTPEAESIIGSWIDNVVLRPKI